MKKLSAIMFFLSLIMIGCTENRVLISELTEEGRLMYYQGEPFTGVAFEMHNESQLKELQKMCNSFGFKTKIVRENVSCGGNSFYYRLI